MTIAEWRWSIVPLCLLLCMAALRPVRIHAQEDDPRLETRLLRTAASQEFSGNLARAEETLRRLMEQRPTSTRGLLALELVLRTQGLVHEILPFAEHYVDLEPNASGPRLLELRVYTELDDKSGSRMPQRTGWMAAGPYSPPYREVARVYGRVFGPKRALSILERGRSALGRPSLFAMEAGDF